jgi:hypothetical protein
MGMSYKHAWLLVEDMNRLFRKRVVAARKGGRRGGGAQRTQRYRGPGAAEVPARGSCHDLPRARGRGR